MNPAGSVTVGVVFPPMTVRTEQFTAVEFTANSVSWLRVRDHSCDPGGLPVRMMEVETSRIGRITPVAATGVLLPSQDQHSPVEWGFGVGALSRVILRV